MEVTEIEAFRQTQCIQVYMLRLDEPELTLQDACQRVGITTQTYYYWIRKEDSAVKAFRDMISITQREMLSDLAIAKLKAVQQLMEAVAKPGTKIKDRVVALKYLDSLSNELQATHHARPGIEEDARQFLKEGPTIRKQASRMASLNISSNPDGSARIDILGPDSETLDADFEDLPQANNEEGESDADQ